MTSFFCVPSFTPLTLEQVPAEPDDISLIVRQEARITQEVRWGDWLGSGERSVCKLIEVRSLLLQLAEVREYHRDAEPLGVIAAQEELESEPEDGLTSEEGAPPLARPPADCRIDGVAAVPMRLWQLHDASCCMRSAELRMQRALRPHDTQPRPPTAPNRPPTARRIIHSSSPTCLILPELTEEEEGEEEEEDDEVLEGDEEDDGEEPLGDDGGDEDM